MTFSTTRTHIAGIPVVELARQFGTPTYVYDAATIVRRLADLSAFDHVRYAQKACSNLAVLDLLRRQRGPCRCGERGRGSPRAGRRICGRCTGGQSHFCRPTARSRKNRDSPPAADHLHRRHLRRRGPRPVRPARNPRQLRLARHDRTARLPRSRPGDHAPHQSGLRPRPQPQDEHRRRPVEARHLARATRPLPGVRRPLRHDRHRAAHAHRLGHGHGTPCAGLRSDGESGRDDRSHGCFDQRRRRPADDLSARRRPHRPGRLLRAVGRRPQAAGRPLRPRASRWKSSRAATWWPRAATW